jgi:hypothetical protein
MKEIIEFAIFALGYLAQMAGIVFICGSILYFVLMFVGGLASGGPHPAIMLPGLIVAGIVSFGIGDKLLKLIGVLE